VEVWKRVRVLIRGREATLAKIERMRARAVPEIPLQKEAPNILEGHSFNLNQSTLSQALYGIQNAHGSAWIEVENGRAGEARL
jgi:hypothetical protein